MELVTGGRTPPGMIGALADLGQGMSSRTSVASAFPDYFLELCGKKFADRNSFLGSDHSCFPQELGVQF